MSQNLPAQNELSARNDVVFALAEQYGMTPDGMYNTLRNTVFKEARNDDEFFALCLVAKQYKLNPLLKQIYAFPSKGGGITPLVGVDGYINVMNRQPDFDGIDFAFAEETVAIGQPPKKLPAWCEARIKRKSCSTPVVVREYMEECYRGTEPWRTHPRRMLRHKALAQCVRLAFGMSGVCADPDDAEPVQATVHDERPVQDVNAVLDAAVEAQPKPKPAQKPAPAPKPARQEKASFKLEEAPASAPEPQPEPAPVPDMSDPRVRANINEDFLDYVEGQGMDKERAEAVCQGLVDGGAAADMTDAHRIFVTMKYTV